MTSCRMLLLGGVTCASKLGVRARLLAPPPPLLGLGRFCSGTAGSGASGGSSGSRAAPRELEGPGDQIVSGGWATETVNEQVEGFDGALPGRARTGVLHTGPEPSAVQVVEALNETDIESYPRLQRPFVDRMWLEVKAGNGGNPAPKTPRCQNLKGPGYGGHGGSVFLRATHLVESFLDVPQNITAAHGGDGRDTHRGKHAKDFCLQVPLGTIVRQRVFSGERTEEGRKIFLPRFVYQLLRDYETFTVAKGGIGGVGPLSFKKNDGRPGSPGERVRLELELRLLNDCALVGLPNSGKTALLAAMSRAHTRIGPEEFSTTRPHVGILRFRDRVEVRVCDLPGLKHGAHADKDLGRRVLRHTYRSRALAFVVDVARGDRPVSETLDEVEMLREEAGLFDPLNREKPWMVIGTKCDSLHKDALFHLDSLHFRLRARYGREVPVVGTSARFGLGLTRLVRTIRDLVFPELLEPSIRVPGAPVMRRRNPGVLHGRFDGPLPSLGELTMPLLMQGNLPVQPPQASRALQTVEGPELDGLPPPTPPTEQLA